MEKAGRLKMNGELFEYSPLSRLVEFEGLTLGVTGKLSLWKVLEQLTDDIPELKALTEIFPQGPETTGARLFL